MAEMNMVQGVEEFTQACDKILYGPADKVVRQSMTAAAKKAVKTLQGQLPNRLYDDLLKYKFKQGVRLKFVNVGLFDNRKTLKDYRYPDTKGNNKRLFSIAYWLNYGTLNRRDPSHKFRERIKAKSRASRRGVHPQKFFERAQGGLDKAYISAFEEELNRRTEKFFEKHAK